MRKKMQHLQNPIPIDVCSGKGTSTSRASYFVTARMFFLYVAKSVMEALVVSQ